MTQHGKIHLITPTETVGNNGFRKRLVVVDRETKHQRYIALEVVKDDCDKFDRAEVGDKIAFEFTASSREYNGRWYNDIRLTSFQISEPEPKHEFDEFMDGVNNQDDQPF